MSDLTTEMSRLSAVDCKTTFEPMKGSISGVTNGLKALGILNEEQTKTLQTIEGALSIITGMLSLVVAVKGLQEVKNTVEEAKAVALTGAMAGSVLLSGGLTGVEVAKRIALATATSVAVGVAINAAVNNIHLGSFNLSTAEGQNQATNAVMEVI